MYIFNREGNTTTGNIADEYNDGNYVLPPPIPPMPNDESLENDVNVINQHSTPQ